jgi:hypothetical protein
MIIMNQYLESDVKAKLLVIRQVLNWYAEQTRLCKLIHSEGDSGRYALSDDGGKRAKEASNILLEMGIEDDTKR